LPPKLTNHKPDKVIKALRRLGWKERTTSSGRNPHKVMKKEGNPSLITIPIHKGRDVKSGLLSDQLKRAGISLDEFLAALKGR
jgi:predicted RNA binding protein YcfA (HicA-like mRNA interferase family)